MDINAYKIGSLYPKKIVNERLIYIDTLCTDDNYKCSKKVQPEPVSQIL